MILVNKSSFKLSIIVSRVEQNGSIWVFSTFDNCQILGPAQSTNILTRALDIHYTAALGTHKDCNAICLATENINKDFYYQFYPTGGQNGHASGAIFSTFR